MEKEKNIIMMVKYYLKENIWMEKYGKGKEYYENGKIKLYDFLEHLLFEGEYLKGKKKWNM